ADARPENCDAVVFTGGYVNNKIASEFIGDTPHAQTAHQFILEMLRQGKHVATICQGTQVLAETRSLPKIHAAKSDYVPPDIMRRNDAIEWELAPVVVSGHVVTGRNWNVGKEFTLKLLEALEQSRREKTSK